jgi:hypothetical protein
LDIVNITGIICKKMPKMLEAKKHSSSSVTPAGLKMSNLNPIGKNYERTKALKIRMDLICNAAGLCDA